AVCAVVCLSLPSAFAEDRLTDAATARTQAGPPADEAMIPDLSGLPEFSGLAYFTGLTSSAFVPDLFVSSTTFQYIKRTQSRTFTGDGFDACTAPPLRAMTAWRKSSGLHAHGLAPRAGLRRTPGAVRPSAAPQADRSEDGDRAGRRRRGRRRQPRCRPRPRPR